MPAMQGHASLTVRDWLEKTIVRGNKPGTSIFNIINIMYSPKTPKMLPRESRYYDYFLFTNSEKCGDV